jgi:hypothetical protein
MSEDRDIPGEPRKGHDWKPSSRDVLESALCRAAMDTDLDGFTDETWCQFVERTAQYLGVRGKLK